MKIFPMLQLILASMAEGFTSVCIKNAVRAYLVAILKNDGAKCCPSILADKIVIIEPTGRKKVVIF